MLINDLKLYENSRSVPKISRGDPQIYIYIVPPQGLINLSYSKLEKGIDTSL